MMTVGALIPAYNEAGGIADLVAAVSRHVNLIVVVDDGSNDGTGERAAAAGATCLRLDRNQGKGAALRLALEWAKRQDLTHVLFMDGDGQHLPDDIPALLARAVETDADLIIGARTFDRTRMPASRYFSNTVGSRVTSRLVGRTILDSQSGFRLARLDCLRGVNLRSRRYEFEMEVLIKLCLHGATVGHAPITMVYNGGRARSKMHPVRDTVRICLWSMAFRYLRL